MAILNIELLFPWDLDERDFPVPVQPETPDPDPTPPPVKFVVNTPDGSGIFTMSGTDAVAFMLDSNNFQLSTPLVTDNGNGSYTAVSE